MRSHFLRAEWKNLVMANYKMPPGLLSGLLPLRTEPDFFNGETFVSLVGFMFMNTRILGLGIPMHMNFEEVNLRFYVRHNDQGNWKRGTVFIKEIVPRPAITLLANSLYGERYATMKMRHSQTTGAVGTLTSYEWKFKNRWNKIAAVSEVQSYAMAPGSEEEFIAEHYWGYTRYSALKTFEYEVSHPRWEVFPISNHEIDCDFGGLYGKEFSFLAHIEPSSVFMAKGSEIKVHHKKMLL
jgi:uncharacterized protein